jgi:hypothetical protein
MFIDIQGFPIQNFPLSVSLVLSTYERSDYFAEKELKVLQLGRQLMEWFYDVLIAGSRASALLQRRNHLS